MSIEPVQARVPEGRVAKSQVLSKDRNPRKSDERRFLLYTRKRTTISWFIQTKRGQGPKIYACLAVALAYAQHLGLEVTGDESSTLPQAIQPAPVKPAKFMIGSAAVSVNEDGLISLTDLLRASGMSRDYRPFEWLRQRASVNFINHFKASSKGGTAPILVKQRGSNGGTYAHWQIALAYAKYLSPELHMQVNEIYARYKAGDATLAEEVIEKVENPEDLEDLKQPQKSLLGREDDPSPGSGAERRQIGRI